MHYLIITALLLFSGISEADEFWTMYDLPDSVNCITGNGDYIWVGTGGGLIKLNRIDSSIVKYTKKDGLAENSIKSVAVDAEGKVFAGSHDFYFENDPKSGGLSILEGSNWRIFRKGDGGLLGSDIAGITIDENNKVWVATNDHYKDIQDIDYPHKYIQAIQCYVDSSWVPYIINTQKQESHGSNITESPIYVFSVINSDSIYYFTYASNKYNPDFFEVIFKDGSLIQKNYFGITTSQEKSMSWYSDIKIERKIGKERKIWASCSVSELPSIVFFNERFTDQNSSKMNELPIGNVEFSYFYGPIFIDKKNDKWFVNQDKTGNKYIVKYNDLNFEYFTCPSWNINTKILSLYADDDGYIWVGTLYNNLWRFDAKNVTAVETAKQAPAAFTLATAYPNPFNASTTISFILNQPGKINLAVYSLTGQKVRELVAGNYSAGNHTAVWDGKDDSGNAVSSGVYLARMESGGVSKVVRMAMVK